MNVTEILKIDGVIYPIVSLTVVLDYDGIGRGIAMIRAKNVVSGMIEYSAGYNGVCPRIFTGYVETCRKVDGQQHRITFREAGGVLTSRWAMSERNTDAQRILKKLSGESGAGFAIIAGNDWEKEPITHFVNPGTGIDVLDSLGAICKVANWHWQSRPDGVIALGPRIDRDVIKLREDFFKELSSTSGTIPFLPKLRPGYRIQIGAGENVNLISSITISGAFMRLEFEKETG